MPPLSPAATAPSVVIVSSELTTGRIRRRVVIAGRVQGVGYRAACARRARTAGVAGSVRNRHDGTVEAVFEGSDAAVCAMVAWCRSGPHWAHVAEVRVSEETPTGDERFRGTA